MKAFLRLAWQVLVGDVVSRVRLHLRLMVYAREHQYMLLARYVEARMQLKYGVFLSHKAQFPRSLDLKHPVGVVIGEGVRLGEGVKIYQNVTLGGARLGDWQANNYPEIGDHTVIFAGAVIVGRVKIGRHCVIGANAVVTKDIPDHATAVGVPARVIHHPSEATPSEHIEP